MPRGGHQCLLKAALRQQGARDSNHRDQYGSILFETGLILSADASTLDLLGTYARHVDSLDLER